MKIVLYAAPTDRPVTPDDVMAHSRIDACDEVEFLAGLIAEAITAAEVYTRRRFCTQTWDQYFDAFTDPLRLSYPPLSSVTSITYTDTDEAEQTVETSVYELGEDNGIGLVRLQYNEDWPTDVLNQPDSVKVRFVCGYGAASAVPGPIKAAIRVHAAHHFLHREGEEAVPKAFYDLLSPYRCWEYC